ncbi:MAG: hypothetical protein M3N08_04710, partial [Pseudomonadota bacterium]|nr:hypothetical protein [Pseudomonadota bacterium]
HSRGMHFMTDVRDWLGGWPTEFSSVPEVADFCRQNLDLELANLRTGEGNSEFLLVYKDQARALGYEPVDLKTHDLSLPSFEDARQLGPGPVWIFGTARGGDLVFKHLTKASVNIAGFIDTNPQGPTLHGLPVLSVEAFAAQEPQTVSVVLANRYFKENSKRLRSAGYLALFNAHPLVIRLHHNRPAAPLTEGL